MLCFNYFASKGAFQRTAEGRYSVNYDKFSMAMNDLTREILVLQGNGDKAAVEKTQKSMAVIHSELQTDLDRLSELGIPVDVVFEQGTSVLGLK